MSDKSTRWQRRRRGRGKPLVQVYYSSRPGMAERVQVRSIRDIFASARAAKRPVVSLEFFPPKDENGEHTLLEKTIPALRQLQPDFCSVTCGAGGNTSAYSRTLQTVDRIQREHRVHGDGAPHVREQDTGSGGRHSEGSPRARDQKHPRTSRRSTEGRH